MQCAEGHIRLLGHYHIINPTQPAFTCSHLATEALEQSVKYVQS